MRVKNQQKTVKFCSYLKNFRDFAQTGGYFS